jgi:hypothetical protein
MNQIVISTRRDKNRFSINNSLRLIGLFILLYGLNSVPERYIQKF